MSEQCCNNSENKKSCETQCCDSSDIDSNLNNINFNNSKKILKTKLTSFINIFNISSKFLENKNLIKNTSPPNIENKIKYYSYSDLVKIIKSNI
jgi:hypothetical protein